MSDLDLNRLLQGHVVLSALAAFDNVPAWNLPLALVGLVVVPQLADGQGAESTRQFVLALGGSILLDFVWFVTHSTHGFVRIAIFLNWLLKFITIATALSSLRARGQGSFNLPGGMGGAGGFSIPGGIADRLPTAFPPFGQQQQRQQQESETVWSAPVHQPTSYQPRFSLDEEASAGSATPPHQAAPTSTSFGGGGVGGKKGGAAAHSAPQAEGGGYHSLE
ncbi:hypothetical protein JCM8208_005701 [Rhodotorula glutinis]